jgi:lactoylglutathione lyase
MRLAKPHLDIGLFTDDVDAQREFWTHIAGLTSDHQLTLEPGWVQHRFDAHGSVIKVNHLSWALPPRPPSGFAGLAIACPPGTPPWDGVHPGGDRVQLVSPGTAGITGIGITISSPDPARMIEFYRTAMEFELGGPDSLRCGDTLLTVVEGPGGQDTSRTDSDGTSWDGLIGPGFRYITVQVFDADDECATIVGRGGRLVRKPLSFAGVARVACVADPDGNWIEISARTSLTGIDIRD